MEYWRGWMNWPVEQNWICETCGSLPQLVWGLTHGVCRCDICHTQYTMRQNGKRVTRPTCLLKENYKAPARAGWKEFGVPISEWTDDMFGEAFKLAKVEPDWSLIMISI